MTNHPKPAKPNVTQIFIKFILKHLRPKKKVERPKKKYTDMFVITGPNSLMSPEKNY